MDKINLKLAQKPKFFQVKTLKKDQNSEDKGTNSGFCRSIYTVEPLKTVLSGSTGWVRKDELSLRQTSHPRHVDRAGRAFLDSRSRVPGVLGTRARGNAIFF